MPPVTPEPQRPADETRPPAPDDKSPTEGYDEDAQLFYERLEQTGQIIDVDANIDMATLPPRVTHVRYPDGTIERVGFSAPPYGM